MIRLILTVVLCVATAIAAVWLTLNPGSLTIEFLGWRAETSAALGAALLIVFTFLLVLIWRVVILAWTAPDAWKRFRGRRRREQGFDALERALIAAASGQGELAVRHAARADAMLDRPALSRLLAARAAEAAGDLQSAEAHYEAMLEDPRTRLVARKGLAAAAEARGDPARALIHAGDAFKETRTVEWAFHALFDAQIAQARWADALDTLKEGERRGHIRPEPARRRRAVLLTVQAMELEKADPDKAAELAEKAASIAPDFPPAAAAAGRLLAAKRRHKRAAELMESAWKARPHPAIARAYAALRKSDSKPKRAARLRTLADLNPHHRESAILRADLSLEGEDPDAARAELEPLLTVPAPSARLLALAARLARLEEREEAARRYMARAAHAPGEPDWSDIDASGAAFAFSEADWRRMVFAFGDEAELIHPRHERYEIAAEAVPETALLAAPGKRKTTRSEPDAAGRTPDAPETTPAPGGAPETPRRHEPVSPYFKPGRAPDDPGVDEER